jgi:hypothetical protein
MVVKKKKEGKIAGLVGQLEVIASYLAEANSEATKFDTKERGWKPAGGRIRKQLQNISVLCKVLRKYISEEKKAVV